MTLQTLLNAPSFPHAKCMEEDPDFFFPDSKVEWEARSERLQQLCSSCIHKTACLSFAIKNQETDGFWGGMTPEQRSHLITKKEDGTRRFREIQEYLSRGLTKEEVAQKLKIQIASLERTLERAKRKGLDQ